MRNFDMKWWIFEKWSNLSGLKCCKRLLSVMYVVIVTQKQRHMPKGSKCILDVLFSLYNKSNNDLFIDNSKTFNNWPRWVQGMGSSWLGMKPPGNISLLCWYCLIIYTNYHNRLCKFAFLILAPWRSSGQDVVCILYSITTCKYLSNCGKEQEASELTEKSGVKLGAPALYSWLLLSKTMQLCRRSEQMILWVFLPLKYTDYVTVKLVSVEPVEWI